MPKDLHLVFLHALGLRGTLIDLVQKFSLLSRCLNTVD